MEPQATAKQVPGGLQATTEPKPVGPKASQRAGKVGPNSCVGVLSLFGTLRDEVLAGIYHAGVADPPEGCTGAVIEEIPQVSHSSSSSISMGGGVAV